MEEALRDVQQLGPLDAELGKRAVQRPEVVLGRLVRPHVLGRDDGREVTSQLPVAAGEPVAVHVRQDDQLVVAPKTRQRVG